MTRNDIIKEIYLDKKYISYCKKIAGKYMYDDLFQYVCLYLMEMDEDKLHELHKTNGLRMYITRIIYISINSNRSDFKLKMFGRIKTDEVENVQLIQEETDNNDEVIIKILVEIQKEVESCIKKNLYPASAKLFEIYTECGSYREVSKKTNIPYLTVRKHIQAFQKTIKERIK